MITIKSNANALAEQLCHDDSVSSFFYATCENYARGFVQQFIVTMQILITKVGIIVSKISTKQVRISYCAASISWLCGPVLNDNNLKNKFEALGLNDKGNRGKHALIKNNIDTDNTVSAYNQLINALISKYGLSSLKALIVYKRYPKDASPNQPKQTYQEYYQDLRKYKYAVNDVVKQEPPKPQPEKTPKKQHDNRKKQPNEKNRKTDERVTLTAELRTGDGFYTKGLFNKQHMLNFVLYTALSNPDGLKIKELKVVIKSGKQTITKKITSNKMPIDINASMIVKNIVATVVCVYKIGLLKTKTIEVSVSKRF